MSSELAFWVTPAVHALVKMASNVDSTIAVRARFVVDEDNPAFALVVLHQNVEKTRRFYPPPALDKALLIWIFRTIIALRTAAYPWNYSIDTQPHRKKIQILCSLLGLLRRP